MSTTVKGILIGLAYAVWLVLNYVVSFVIGKKFGEVIGEMM